MISKKKIKIISSVFLSVFILVFLSFTGTIFADPTDYDIGDVGPAGGFIFYDKGYDSDGWRYLEAAWGGQTSVSLDREKVWRNDGTSISTGTDIGTGRTNTEAILAVDDSGDNAAKFCDNFSVFYNGKYYNDWFLPSRDELVTMLNNLKNKTIWFIYPPYWSSSQSSATHAYDCYLDTDGIWKIGNVDKSFADRVRPIRAFSIEEESQQSSPSNLLTHKDWVLMDLKIDQLLANYGPTPEGFVKMLYDTILGRVPDAEGEVYWTEQLNSDAFTGSQLVEHFIFSDELSVHIVAMSNEEFITFLYNSFLSRNPDSEGFENWAGYMNSGVSKLDTLRAFMNNQEWFDICAMFNVTP